MNSDLFHLILQTDYRHFFSQKALKVLHEDYQTNLLDRLNQLTAGTQFEDSSIYDIIEETARVPVDAAIFNHASQAFNNQFFLDALTDRSGNGQSFEILTRIKREFGGLDIFKLQFKHEALAIFGSGWTWLVETEFQMLRIVNSYNSGTVLDTRRTQNYQPNDTGSFAIPISLRYTERKVLAPSAVPSASKPDQGGYNPLLVLNVWEHAYMTDYGVHGREQYIDNFWHCIDWDKVNKRIRQG